MWDDFHIFGGYNRRLNLGFAGEELSNLFLIGDDAGKKKMAFLSTPGLQSELIVTSGTKPSRALFEYEGFMYGVFGDAVYRFTTTLIPILLGYIGTDFGNVSIDANNGGQIIFVDGQYGYLYNITTGIFGRITSEGFPPRPLNVAFLDGYFVIPSGESRTYQISALNDGSKWDVLDFASIQAYPGVNVGVGVVNRRLYFFKTDTTEVWFNQGAADFPFRRDNNLIFNYGCLSSGSIVSDFGYLFWLANDASGVGSVMMTTGQVPKRVSNDAIEELIASFDSPSDVNAYIYKEDGNIFVVFNFTIDDKTIVYNLDTDKWHTMEMQKHLPIPHQPNSSKTRHLGNCHAYFNGIHYVGSYKKPQLYSFSSDYPDNDGEPIRRYRTCSHFFDNSYKLIQIDNIQIDMEMGIGNTTGIYSDPKVYLSLSKDGGHVFGNDCPATIGKIGKRKTRAMFRKKGQARDIVARISIYASVAPIIILGASINYEVLRK